MTDQELELNILEKLQNRLDQFVHDFMKELVDARDRRLAEPKVSSKVSLTYEVDEDGPFVSIELREKGRTDVMQTIVIFTEPETEE